MKIRQVVRGLVLIILVAAFGTIWALKGPEIISGLQKLLSYVPGGWPVAIVVGFGLALLLSAYFKGRFDERRRIKEAIIRKVDLTKVPIMGVQEFNLGPGIRVEYRDGKLYVVEIYACGKENNGKELLIKL
jgi:hypothetical protein